MKKIKNIILNPNGTLENVRKNLPKKYRYITQIVTVKKAHIVCGAYGGLEFKIECKEGTEINIFLKDNRDISRVQGVFSLMEVETEEEMKGKKIIRYLDIRLRMFGIGTEKEDGKRVIVGLLDPVTPYTEEQLIHQHIGYGYEPSVDEWRNFCRMHEKKKSQE